MSESSSQWIADVTAANFEKAVLEQSQECPVIVDFWAPWCGPCRELGPMLEKIVDELAGQVRLVKINTEQEQELAMNFGVQSIPMVLAVKNGEFVDRFDGLLPEEEIRKWVGQLLPSEVEQLIIAGREQEQSAPAEAEQSYRKALEIDESCDAAKVRLAAALLAQQKYDEVEIVLSELEKRGFLEPEAEKIKSQTELAVAAEESGGVEEARKAVEANPDDSNKRILLADALAAAGQYEEAFEICLDVVRADRSGSGNQARDTMVRIFNTLGNENPLVSEYRRKLATALY